MFKYPFSKFDPSCLFKIKIRPRQYIDCEFCDAPPVGTDMQAAGCLSVHRLCSLRAPCHSLRFLVQCVSQQNKRPNFYTLMMKLVFAL